ncbi:MAG: histidine kinase [Acidobacteriota bacterium]|nr:histidine kinase [Acidobacteriota bacterium]
MRLFNKLFLGFCLCFCFTAAQAQYRFDSWTTDDGLPQNSVFSILQTRDGYVWFTTLDGLVRFDGIKFKVFNRSNSPGLTTNRLIYLLAEDDDAILVGTEDGGLLRFEDGKFRAFTIADGLSSVKVSKVFKDFDGNLLAATQAGLARFDGEKFIAENQLDARDYALYFAPSGIRWELSQNGLTAAQNGQITKYELPFELNQISADRTFNFPDYVAMLEDRRNPGVLWLTAAAKLYRLENGEFTAFSAADGMPQSFVRAIVQDAAGVIWLGTDKDGLCRFAENRVTCYTTADGLSSNTIMSLFIDREQTLWATTSERGINRVTRKAITTLSEKDGLFDGNIYPLLQDRQGNFWIGAFSALSLYRDGKITNFTAQNGLLYEIVQSLYQDKDGRIWIGSVGGAEYFENGRFVDFTETLGLPIGDYDFWDIYQTAEGAMWFATHDGLFKYENGNVSKFTIENGLPSGDVKKILQTADGNLWFGTLGGLARFNGNRFEAFTEKDGLPRNHVRTIYEDAHGSLWIGTYDSGLSLFRNGKFTKITTENGLFSNGVFQILSDEHGNFWMSSNQGIYRVSRQQLIDFADNKISSVVSTAFGKSDGMLSIECNGGRQTAGIKTSDGKLWFPTQDGVAIVDPEAVAFNPLPLPVVIETVKIENQLLDNFQTAIEIQPGQENLEIGYTGLSFIKPEQIRFRYWLEGLDEDWTFAGERRAAYFPYLPPGNYTFRVAAANSDNVWNETGAVLSIVVKPSFYQTWWFLALSVLAIGGAAFVVYKIRINQVERARLAQEDFSRRLINAHEAERSRVAAELHDSIGQTLAMIKNRAAFGSQTEDNTAAKEQLAAITATFAVPLFAMKTIR